MILNQSIQTIFLTTQLLNKLLFTKTNRFWSQMINIQINLKHYTILMILLAGRNFKMIYWIFVGNIYLNNWIQISKLITSFFVFQEFAHQKEDLLAA